MPPTAVLITEEGPREGFQIEKGPIPTGRKVELIDALSETGLQRIQVASFVSRKQVPGMADADDIARRIRIKPGVEYTALWFNDAGLERARASGHLTLEGKVRVYPSDAFLKRNINRTPEQHLAHTNAEIARFKELAEQSDAELKSALEHKAAAQDAENSDATPRNAPCPCGSGQKYKRCCGRDAPGVIDRAA